MLIRFVVTAQVETDAPADVVSEPIHETVVNLLARDLVSDRDTGPGSYRILSWGIEPYPLPVDAS